MAISSFSETHLRELARVLGEAVSHGALSTVFRQLGIDGPEAGAGSKQRRIWVALSERQRKDGCGNNVGKFIETVLDPALFLNDSYRFAQLRDQINEILAFSGLHLQATGKLASVAPARTLSEAQERAGKLRAELLRRQVHADVLAFCRPELVDQNYFHAVFEATKSVAEKIRQKTGLVGDGSDLVDKAFGLNSPMLAINTLRTEAEQSEQKGFANLLRGVFGTFRNPTAHAPKVMWPVSEQDALDLLSLLSYLHRRLDSAVAVPKTP